VFTTNEAWALKFAHNRNFGDFRHWKDHDVYQKTLARLLRDLRVEPAGAKQTDHHPTDRRGRS
jgi:hypothetical protein